MAQVTRREITVPSTGVPTIPTPKVQPSPFGAALGVIGEFVQAKNAQIIRTKEVDFQTNSLSQFRTFADKLQGELKPNFGDDLNGYSVAYQEQMKRQMETIIEDAPTPGSRNVMVAQLGQVMDSFNGRARKDEENAVVEAAKIHLDQAINGYINEIFREPDKIQENLALIKQAVEDAPWIEDVRLGNKFLKAKTEEAWMQYAKHFRENDPKELLADINDGFYDKKFSNPDVIPLLKDQADAQIFRNDRRGDAEKNRALRALAKDVTDFVAVTDTGDPWEGDVDTLRGSLLQMIDTGGESGVRAAEMLALVDESVEDGADLIKFNALTVPGMLSDVQANIGKPTTRRGQRLLARKVRALKQTQDAIDAGLGFDLAVKRGIIKKPEPFNISDPSIRDAQLAERIDMANTASEWLGIEVSPITAGEKVAFARTLQGTDLRQQEQLLDFLSQLPPAMRRRTANDLSKDAPEFAIALDIQPYDGRSARAILGGLSIIRSEKQRKEVPPDTLFADGFREEMGTAFTRSAVHENAVFQAAKAIYVSKAFAKGLLRKDDIDSGLWQEAMKDATGGVITRGTGILGGFFSPGHKIVPPVWGMDDDEFDAIIQDPVLWENLAVNTTPESARQNGTFIHKGAGQYNIIMPDDRPILNRDGSGDGFFVLDLSDIERLSLEDLDKASVAKEVQRTLALELKAL